MEAFWMGSKYVDRVVEEWRGMKNLNILPILWSFLAENTLASFQSSLDTRVDCTRESANLKYTAKVLRSEFLPGPERRLDVR